MKCEFCGASLDLEAAYCSHCGKPNRYAQQHIQDMNRYQGKFEDTRKDVYKTARRYSDLLARVIAAAVLVIVLVVLIVLQNSAYRIQSSIQVWKARANKAEHTAVMDAYLEQEDFLQFAQYCSDHGISRYNSGFDEYRYICTIASDYQRFCEQLLWMVFPPDYNTDGTAGKIEFVCDYLDYFYKEVYRDEYYDLSEEEAARTREYGQVMKECVDALLMTYCHLTEEDLAEFPDLSKSKRAVLIEERMSDGE